MRVLFRSVLATLQQSTARPIPSSQDEIGRRLHSRRNRDRVASSAPVLRLVRRALLVECLAACPALRSDERRVGKECGSTCRARGSPHTEKKITVLNVLTIKN